VRDLGEPEFGEPVSIEEDQLPVFWACGVTQKAQKTGTWSPEN